MTRLSVYLKTLLAKTYGKWFNLVAIFSPDRAARLAMKTFAKVRKGRVKPEQQPFLDEARHSVEMVDGEQIQTYQWSGSGPRVLLIHGWESNTFRWRKLIRILREEGFHVIAFDAPAHGYSTGKILHVPLYSECVEHMVQAFDPKYIIGHSVGGMTALYDATYASVGATLAYAKRLTDQDFDVNAAVYIVTDGMDNRSATTP
ncbi:MAG: alpha/beta fold hydrolase, partial [Robiginitalea sp.]|nr:alpha/beta fold hydrolase [Robiginitalea sp.]